MWGFSTELCRRARNAANGATNPARPVEAVRTRETHVVYEVALWSWHTPGAETGCYARRVGNSNWTRVVIPSLRATTGDSRRTRRRMASTGLFARPKFSLRISLPARITAARSSA